MENEERQGRQILDHERQILIRLFYILEKKKLISAEERETAVRHIKTGAAV